MTINEIAELAYRQIYPTSGDAPPVTLVEFKRTAIYEYAYQALLFAWNEKQREGYYQVPSHLLDSKVLKVENNEIDISGINVFSSLPGEVWLQSVGGVGCDCKYVKFTLNNYKLLCEDESLDDTDVPFYVLGKKIVFPQGVKKKELPVHFASIGSTDEETEVDAALAVPVRNRLMEIYGNRLPKDVTLNDNPNN